MSKRAVGFLASHSTDQASAVQAADPGVSLAQRIGTELNVQKTILSLLFPTGVHPSRFDDELLIKGIWKCLENIATRKDCFGESPYKDIVEYATIGAAKDEPYTKKEGTPCPSVGETV